MFFITRYNLKIVISILKYTTIHGNSFSDITHLKYNFKVFLKGNDEELKDDVSICIVILEKEVSEVLHVCGFVCSKSTLYWTPGSMKLRFRLNILCRICEGEGVHVKLV